MNLKRQMLWKKAKLALLTLAAMPIVVLIRVLRPFVLIRYGPLHTGRIGHLGANTELYLCERDRGIPAGRVADFFYFNTTTCNEYLSQRWKERLRVAEMVRVLDLTNRRLPGGDGHIICTGDVDNHDLLGSTEAHLSFGADDERLGLLALKEMGIQEGSPFICLYVRDSAYLEAEYPNLDWRYHDFRDAAIEKSLLAADELVDRGYFVIRMGAVVQKRLDTGNPRIIDYASDYRTDFLDIFLSSKCKFFLGSTGGLNAILRIFRTPIAYMNFVPLSRPHLLTCTPGNLVIPKKLWLREKRRFMTFRETLEAGAGRYFHSEDYERLGIEPVENTPEEITALAVEMDERLNGTWQTTQEDQELQQRFWSLFNPSHMCYGSTSRFGAEFLRQYGPMMRRRIRGKLGTQMRRVFDSEDIFSTVSRRLDRFIRSGRLNASTAPQMWALMFKMADAAVVDKVRITTRMNRITEVDQSGRKDEIPRPAPINHECRMDLERAFALLKSDQDRQILSLWLSGARHDVIAEAVGLTHATTRKRWQSIRRRLREWATREVL